MTTRPDPICADAALHAGRQTLDGNQAAPCGQSCEERLGVSANLLSDFGMNAVRAHDNVALMAFPVLEHQPGAILVLFETDTAAAQMKRSRRALPECLQQDAMEIAAVDHPIRRSIHRARRCAEIEQLPGLAGAVKPDLFAGGLASDGSHLLFEIERDEN